MKRLVAYAVRKEKGVTVWIKAGTAVANRDGSLNVYLDVLPIDGKLHLREAGEDPADVLVGKVPADEVIGG